jgi:hypothetical protein
LPNSWKGISRIVARSQREEAAIMAGALTILDRTGPDA